MGRLYRAWENFAHITQRVALGGYGMPLWGKKQHPSRDVAALTAQVKKKHLPEFTERPLPVCVVEGNMWRRPHTECHLAFAE
jgi:hypothetical protein